MASSELYIGIMSGTSLDGTDAVLATFDGDAPALLASAYQPFDAELRQRLLELNRPGTDELHRAALTGNALARCYSAAVEQLLRESGTAPHQVVALGCHGQTVRHRPDAGYSLQIGNPALLAELTRIDVVADFRSRDIAAGGHGAPLVPAFHDALFREDTLHRVIVNVGGISNLTSLAPGRDATGFDCGPGNVLMDGWIERHRGVRFDNSGAWAETGAVIPELLDRCLAHPYFALRPPKSTGRDEFNLHWLEQFLRPGERPQDVQRTLLEFTARVIGDAVRNFCPGVAEVYLCGGGAHNRLLMHAVQARLPDARVGPVDALGVGADWLEAFAFAWLARQAVKRLPGNMPQVTGAAHHCILGALYPR